MLKVYPLWEAVRNHFIFKFLTLHISHALFSMVFFRTVYVADFGNKRLVGFKRFPRNELVQIWVSCICFREYLSKIVWKQFHAFKLNMFIENKFIWKQWVHQKTDTKSIECASLLGQTSWFRSLRPHQ